MIGHGSRDPAGNAEFLRWAEEVERRGGWDVVEPCFIELAEPDVQTGVDRCVRRGAERVVALPITLLAAGHAKLDVPRHLERARARHPGVDFRYGRALGVHSLLVDVLAERLAEVEASAPHLPPEQTAVLLVGRGSSDPDANGDLCKVARLVWERCNAGTEGGYGWVESCYIGVTRPDFPSGLRRCAALGARRAIVLPYFLFTGVLVRRLPDLAERVRGEVGGLDVRFAAHLGDHPNLTRLVLERAREAADGRVAMNCDACRYRTAIEERVGGHQHHGHDDRDHAHDDRMLEGARGGRGAPSPLPVGE